jgi:hypothetical protein
MMEKDSVYRRANGLRVYSILSDMAAKRKCELCFAVITRSTHDIVTYMTLLHGSKGTTLQLFDLDQTELNQTRRMAGLSCKD